MVREGRNQGRWLVEVHGRTLVVAGRDLSPVERPRGRRRQSGDRRSGGVAYSERQQHACEAEVDLHGLTVPEALARAGDALNDAMLAGRGELRLIHGRGRRRIRAALHAWLTAIPGVRGFRQDPRNEGVTIISL